jgi:pimeloyl-ACP methyl ester carboxylesterase
MPNSLQPKHLFVSAPDGMKLHVAEYGAAEDPGVPIVCLPGLARTVEDFDPLARALAFEGRTRRRVLAIDYRGRGLSEYDKDWNNYSIPVENADILATLAALGISRGIFVGTSRGGMHILTLTATRPTILHAAVLNDIGPVVEPLGLIRIKGYVGKLPIPRNWMQAVEILKSVMSAQFTGLSDEDWRAYAATTYVEKEGKFALRYDAKLMKTLDSVGPDMPRIELWPQFEALATIPVLAIRGENSDLLSRETFEAMQKRIPDCEGWVVPQQGHAPLLTDGLTITRIGTFIDRVG